MNIFCLHKTLQVFTLAFFQDAGEAESSKRRAEELQSPAAAGGPVAAKRLRPDDDEPEIMPAPGGPATTASDMQQ